MASNPYAPPGAPVADVEVAPISRPKEVDTACKLYWWSFAASTAGTLTEVVGQPSTALLVGALVGAAFGGLIGALITWWFVSKLKAGRNWMRLFLTIMPLLFLASFALFWSFYVMAMRQYYAGAPIRLLISTVQSGIGLWALVLINTARSRQWFRSMKQARASAA